MQKITAFFSKPLYFALLMGTLIGTMVYYVGHWSVEPRKLVDDQVVTIAAQDISNAYLLGVLGNSPEISKKLLTKAVVKATGRSNILSATVLSNTNAIIAMANRKNVTSSDRSGVFTQKIMDQQGHQLGLITMALHEDKGMNSQSAETKAQWMALLGFLLGFALSFSMLQKAGILVPQLKSAFRMVSLGHMDVQLPAVDDPDFMELSDAFDQMLEGLRERDRMRHSLGRIMDPKIAEILIKEDPKLGGLRRQATILFCDIRNYTSICEELTPDQLQEFLNDYWKGTVEIIMEQEGTIDKFHGDGVCVIFGAPALHDDDPMRAVRSAWQLVQNVELLNKRREAERKVPIQIGVGIHSGEVIAGHIGSDRRMDYTVVGDVVNVAARIEELNKKFGTKILISDHVYEKVESCVKVKTLTLAHLRGHKKPILIHTILDFADVAAAEQRKVA